ncbi:hypothetical protein OSB04_022047, partial [Centaurea solstitialis]
MKLQPWLSICSSTTHHQPPSPSISKLSDTTTNNISHTVTSAGNGWEQVCTISQTAATAAAITGFQKLSLETLTLTVSDHVNFLAVHNRLLYAAAGNLIHVIDIASFALLTTVNVAGSSSGSVKSVTFSNGNIFTAHQDNKIRVWKLTENGHHKRIATLPTFKDRLIRSVSPKNYVHVRRHRKKLWIEHHDAVSGLALVTDRLMCSVSWDKYLKIWRTSDFRCVESIKAHDDAINAVVAAADGTIYTASADRRIKVWGKGLKKYGLIATLDKHTSAVNTLALNDDGSVLFSGSGEGSIFVWGKEHGGNRTVLTGTLSGHSKAILCLVTFSDLLLSGSADRTVRIWQRGREGKFCCLKVLDGYKRPVRSLVADLGETASGSDPTCTLRVFSDIGDGDIRMLSIKDLNYPNSMSTHYWNPPLLMW